MSAQDMSLDSLSRNIIRSVRILVVSEVLGAEAAAFAERHARNAAQREIWATHHDDSLAPIQALLGNVPK